MRLKSWLLLLYTIDKVKLNESCSRINLSDELNLFNGEYVSQFQHNGNQEYFRSDGKFNLFAMEEENCQWRISNLEENFPFSILEQDNCETLFVDSKFVWETFNSENEIQQPNEIVIKCIISPGDDFEALKISIFVIVIIVSIILLILMHVNIRKRRILKATNECKICKTREESIKNLNQSNF